MTTITNIAGIQEIVCYFCKRSQFLAIVCKSCNQKFCDQHSSIEKHGCNLQILNQNTITSEPKKQRKCSKLTCFTKLNLTNAINCKECGQEFCLPHRMQESHDCEKLTQKKQQNIITQNYIQPIKEVTIKIKKPWYACFTCGKNKK